MLGQEVGGAGGGRAIRMLVIDENKLSRATLMLVFAGRGYDCVAAATASEARMAAIAFRPDIVLLDWVFRDASGIGLAQRLRDDAMVHGRRLQIVALSVWEEPFAFAVREGIDLYYVKPASVIEIDRAIRDRLRSAA